MARKQNMVSAWFSMLLFTTGIVAGIGLGLFGWFGTQQEVELAWVTGLFGVCCVLPGNLALFAFGATMIALRKRYEARQGNQP